MYNQPILDSLSIWPLNEWQNEGSMHKFDIIYGIPTNKGFNRFTFGIGIYKIQLDRKGMMSKLIAF